MDGSLQPPGSQPVNNLDKSFLAKVVMKHDHEFDVEKDAKKTLVIGATGAVVLITLFILMTNGLVSLTGQMDPTLLVHFEVRVSFVLTHLIFLLTSLYAAWIALLISSYKNRVDPIKIRDEGSGSSSSPGETRQTRDLNVARETFSFVSGQTLLTGFALIMSVATIQGPLLLVTTPLVSYSFVAAVLVHMIGSPTWHIASLPLFLLPQLLLILVSFKAVFT